ncbi:hypothetical protein ASZ90_019865 [hydrocarbon metagenome]|uniref:DUF2382 domain-containing protein n=1 Tax=hydrocarbon metagenome TaxID=938273 RepID=A0A0W8E2G7_9ZZZZ
MANESQNKITFPLREEELEVKRKWVETGEINCHKEVLTEEKTITVPVKREELIIEKKILDADSPDQSTRTEIIRIPLREERVEINKQTYDLETVEIYKQQLHEYEIVDAMLKKEVMSTKTFGDVDIKTS